MKRFYVVVIALFSCTLAFAQGTITGNVQDGDLGGPLLGATVMVKGTNNGTTTDFDGNFTLEVTESSGTLIISYLGYISKSVGYSSTGNIGTISLTPDAEELSEVVVVGSGVIDLAKERETPVAVSTIKASEIVSKVGNLEFPEVLNRTPSVYATKQGGGYGDSRITVRGFSQRNTSFIINGQPVNDMENGWVYWSNWQGLSDVASGMQVQRGLGASKLAVPSVGGTVTIVTKSTDKEEGGFVGTTMGNDSYIKTIAGYNTGTNENGWATSVLLGRWTGDGYVDGTKGEGYTYLFSLGYKPSEQHAFNFTFTGAGQWHHQRTADLSIRDYQNFGGDDEINRKLNITWGTRLGEEYNIRRNFYNKPIGTLNWDWNISDNVSLSSSFYGSWGRGGGTGPRGNNFRNSDINLFPFRIDFTEHMENGNGVAARKADGSIDFDYVASVNRSTTANYTGANSNYEGLKIGSNGFRDDGVNRAVLVRRASMNSHNWYGAISNLKIENNKWTYGLGIDLRSYKGFHYRALNDLLGLDGYYSTGNRNLVNGTIQTETIIASPFNDTGLTGHKIDYYNVGEVRWGGFNGIIEYKNEEKVSAVLQAGISNQSYRRKDYFDSPNFFESDRESITGGYVKGGANFNLDAKNNVFFNAGYIARQPLFDAVFPGFRNDINEEVGVENITSFELGYGFRTYGLRVDLNVYSTSWKDRWISRGVTLDGGIDGTAQFAGVGQLHQGIELEVTARPTDNLRLQGMMSLGSWKYTENVTANVFDDNNQQVGSSTLFIEDVKVGDAAQTTFFAEAQYELFEKFNIDLGWRHAANLYADFDVAQDDIFLEADNAGALELPSYSLVDLGLDYTFDFGGSNLFARLNVNNVFDTVYIAESETNFHATTDSALYDGIDTSNFVWFGFGTTWNVTLRYNF